jgi:hypothetical protein
MEELELHRDRFIVTVRAHYATFANKAQFFCVSHVARREMLARFALQYRRAHRRTDRSHHLIERRQLPSTSDAYSGCRAMYVFTNGQVGMTLRPIAVSCSSANFAMALAYPLPCSAGGVSEWRYSIASPFIRYVRNAIASPS